MARYVAFLRAINVGGRVVKMDQLRKLFESMGLANVTTLIASGNVLFESRRDAQALQKKIGAELRKALGYDVGVFIRTAEEVAQIATHRAFDESELANGGSLFICFLEIAPGAREKKLIAGMRTTADDLHVHNREMYWLARRNFQGAEFSLAKLEKALGSGATFRNVNTVKRIAAIHAGEASGPKPRATSPKPAGGAKRQGR